ncbi:hypothetical protein CHU98_g8836 [Xylaria longipes]|nr:hypothetical protein CHU98_g8836 [Xylaria longipes]
MSGTESEHTPTYLLTYSTYLGRNKLTQSLASVLERYLTAALPRLYLGTDPGLRSTSRPSLDYQRLMLVPQPLILDDFVVAVSHLSAATSGSCRVWYYELGTQSLAMPVCLPGSLHNGPVSTSRAVYNSIRDASCCAALRAGHSPHSSSPVGIPDFRSAWHGTAAPEVLLHSFPVIATYQSERPKLAWFVNTTIDSIRLGRQGQ